MSSKWYRRQCMILSQNYHTPTSFWLGEKISNFSAWIRDSNELIEEQKRKK